MANLASEMNAAGLSVRQVHLDRLRALGVSNATIATMGERGWPFGVTNAEPVGGGYYQPGEGAPHIILPVVEDGVLVDLVAFRSTAPNDWLLRVGNGSCLGLEEGLSRWTWYAPADPDAKPPKYQVGQPTHLFSTPLDWLAGGGEGLCVLDWEAPDLRQLDVLPAITVSDRETGALLTQALRRPERIPRIDVIERWANVA